MCAESFHVWDIGFALTVICQIPELQSSPAHLAYVCMKITLKDSASMLLALESIGLLRYRMEASQRKCWLLLTSTSLLCIFITICVFILWFIHREKTCCCTSPWFTVYKEKTSTFKMKSRDRIHQELRVVPDCSTVDLCCALLLLVVSWETHCPLLWWWEQILIHMLYSPLFIVVMTQ